MLSGIDNRRPMRNREFEAEPQFKCDHTDCEEREWEKDYLILCEGCGGRFCKDHVRKIGCEQVGDLDFCEKCAKCQKPENGKPCGDRADFTCANCGNPLCAGDARGRITTDPETGYTEAFIVCRGGCGDSIEINPREVVALQEEEHADCPF